MVAGSVIFNNEMRNKQPQLRAALGEQTASSFGGGSAGASVGIIKTLPDNEKYVARSAFADSLSTMWIMYTCFAFVGLLVSLLITKNVLDKKHEDTKTGIDAEKEKRAEREAERAERRKKRNSKGVIPIDTEAQAQVPSSESPVSAAGDEKDVKV